MYGYYGGYYYDWTYLLVLIGMVLCLGASALVRTTMSRYSRFRVSSGITGAEAAQRILHYEGVGNVQVVCLQSGAGDHYDPVRREVRLSYENYYGNSITAVAVAAHECGHAVQHAYGYAPLVLRHSLVPVVNICNFVGMPLILLGVLLSFNPLLIQIGIWTFVIALAFQIVTLPVEFNASGRAVVMAQQYGLVSYEEEKGCRKVLTAAALTYVAAAAASALQLLRLLLLFGGGRRRR